MDGLSLEDHAILERELARHGDCEGCRRLEKDFHDTAGRMAFALEPVAVDPAMVETILATERTIPAVPIPEAPAADELAERRTKRRRLVTAAIGVAAAFALVVGAFAVVANRGGGTTVASASPTQTVVRFTPTADGAGELAMAYTPGQPGVVVWGSGLPDPGDGKTYELWMITGDEPVSGGCLLPVDGTVALFVDANVAAADTMAVTAEPGACPSAPTGPPLLTAPLTA